APLAVPDPEGHPRALGNETPDRRLAHPRCPARPRRNLAVEPSHVRHPSLHYETRIDDTSYPAGGHRLVGPARMPDLNRLRKLRGRPSRRFDGLARPGMLPRVCWPLCAWIIRATIRGARSYGLRCLHWDPRR